MRIAMLGNFDVPFSSENHHASTLTMLGHTVVRIQEGSHSHQILAAASGCDVFVWIHSHGWAPCRGDGIAVVLHKLRMQGAITLTYHLDLYLGIPERFAEYRAHPYFLELDHFFTCDPKLVEYLNSSPGIRTQGHYLPPGVFAEECYLTRPPGSCAADGFDHEVIFVGSYNYHKSWPYRRTLIDWLRATYQGRFEGFGPDFGKSVRGRELNELYANSKIVVGDSYSPGFDYPGYWSDRVPETLGRGGFLIHPWIEDIDDQFTDGEHLALYDFGDFEQLDELIRYYLEHDDERESIRHSGHLHVLNHHTFTHRWRHILREVGRGETD